MNKKLVKILKNILYWKDKANTTSGMLLSSHHKNSEECGRIMKNYEESFERARQICKIYDNDDMHNREIISKNIIKTILKDYFEKDNTIFQGGKNQDEVIEELGSNIFKQQEK